MKIVAAIPNYRNSESLEALLGQLATLGLYKIYVLDDASPSTDGIKDIVNRYGQATLVSSKERLLITKNRNRVLDLDMGDITLFIDSDMVLGEAKLLNYLEQDFSDATVGIVGGAILEQGKKMPFNFGAGKFFPIDQSWLFAWLKPLSRLVSIQNARKEKAPQSVTWVAEGLMAVRSSLFVKLGGFDEKFKMFHEGPDLCIRARGLGCKTLLDPRIIMHHLGIQNVQKAKQVSASSAYWFEKHYGWPQWLTEFLFR